MVFYFLAFSLRTYAGVYGICISSCGLWSSLVSNGMSRRYSIEDFITSRNRHLVESFVLLVMNSYVIIRSVSIEGSLRAHIR